MCKFLQRNLVLLFVLSFLCAGALLGEQPPKVAPVGGPADVVRYSITNSFEGGVIKQVASPMVPLNPSANPDMYMVTLNRHTDGRTIRAVTLTFDRKGKYAEYDQVIIKDGKTIPVSPNFEQDLLGRKIRNYMVMVSDTSYAKWANEGVDLTFTGKSGRFNVVIPAFVFTTMEELFQGMLKGPGSGLPAAPQMTAADTNRSSFLRTGSVGTESKQNAVKLGNYELAFPKGEAMVGMEFIFQPGYDSSLEKKYGYRVPRLELGVKAIEELNYQKYVGRTLKVTKGILVGDYLRANSLNENASGLHISMQETGALLYEAVVVETGDTFVLPRPELEEWPALAPKRDLEFAAKELTGKTFWINSNRAFSYHEGDYASKTHRVTRWQPVTVTDIILSQSLENPVRVVFKTGKDETYFLDISISAVRRWKLLTHEYAPGVGEAKVPVAFDAAFLLEDPRKKYNWSEEAFTAVIEGRAEVGMTMKQINEAWGEPNSITKSATLSGDSQSWSYQDALVSFTEGKCISVVSGARGGLTSGIPVKTAFKPLAEPAPEPKPEKEMAAKSEPPPAPAPKPAPSPYLRSGSIGATPPTEDIYKLSEYELPEIETDKMAGQSFIFLPMARDIRSRGYKFKVFDGAEFEEKKFAYDARVGQELKILSVQKMSEFLKEQIKDEIKLRFSTAAIFYKEHRVLKAKIPATGDEFFTIMDEQGAMAGNVVLKRDIDFAIAKLPKKTFWLRSPEVYAFDEASDQIIQQSIPKWQPVEITDVTLGCDASPIRVVFKDSAGNHYFEDIRISAKHSVQYDYYGKPTYGYVFPVYFLPSDPSKKYSWPEDIMKLVKSEKIRVGMTPEQVWASWGGAKSTNRFSIGNRTSVQWIYPSAQVVFDQGKCISIIDQ